MAHVSNFGLKGNFPILGEALRPGGVFAYAVSLTFCLAASLILVGVSTLTAFKISCYVWFIVMPLGSVVVRLMLPENQKTIVVVGLGASFGLLVHPLTVAPLYVFDIVDSYIWLACIGASLIWFFELQKNGENPTDSKSDRYSFWVIVGVTTLISTLCFLSSANGTGELGHFRVQALGVSTLLSGWPSESPYVAGIPDRNNFGVHLSLLAITNATGVTIAELGGYAAQMTYLWLAIFAFGVIARTWLNLSIFSLVSAMMAAYFVLGFSPINTYIYGTAQSAAAMSTLSPLLGHIGFLLSLMVFSIAAAAPNERLSKLTFFALLLLGAATMLARANAGALLGISVLFYWLFKVVKTRSLQLNLAIYVWAVGIGCIGAMLFSLGSPFGGQFSGTRFLSFGTTQTLTYLAGVPVSKLAQSAGLSVVISGAIAYFVIVLLQSSFLAPFFWTRAAFILAGNGSAAEVLILFSVGFGVLATLFSFAPGGSNFVFLQLAKLGMCLLGALGLDAAIASWKAGNKSPRLFLALGIVLGCIHFFDAAEQARKLQPFSRLLSPSPVEALQGKRFDIVPLLENIKPTKKTRFIFVHADENLWGYFGRASTAMVDHDIKLVVSEQVQGYTRFSKNIYSKSLEELSDNFDKLNSSAVGGFLDLPCVVHLAEKSLDPRADIYLLSEKNLKIINHPSVTRLTESTDLVAWRVDTSGKVPATCS